MVANKSCEKKAKRFYDWKTRRHEICFQIYNLPRKFYETYSEYFCMFLYLMFRWRAIVEVSNQLYVSRLLMLNGILDFLESLIRKTAVWGLTDVLLEEKEEFHYFDVFSTKQSQNTNFHDTQLTNPF